MEPDTFPSAKVSGSFGKTRLGTRGKSADADAGSRRAKLREQTMMSLMKFSWHRMAPVFVQPPADTASPDLLCISILLASNLWIRSILATRGLSCQLDRARCMFFQLITGRTDSKLSVGSSSLLSMGVIFIAIGRPYPSHRYVSSEAAASGSDNES